MPEGLQDGSPTGEKLNAVTEIDLEGALEALQEANNADLPVGFGRD